MSTTTSYTSTTVNELEPRYSCLVYPSASPNVQKGDPGAGCPYCTCYGKPPIQFQDDGDWTQELSKPGVNQATDYQGLDTSTGNSYIGKETEEPDGVGGTKVVWGYVIANQSSSTSQSVNGGVV